MSHYGMSNQKTTAGNFAAKASYFEKKLKELQALREKRIDLGAERGVTDEVMAAELAKVDAEIAAIVSQVEGDQGTGREDYYHKSGNDTLASGIAGPLANKLGLGEHPQDGDYLALFRGINPRTGEAFLDEKRQKAIDKAIQEAESKKANPSSKKQLDAGDLERLEKDGKEKSAKDPVLGFSSCVSLQKSISIYWAQADDQTRRVIQECMMGAVNDAIEREHRTGRIRGREGAQGAESVTGECVTLTYAHCTARRAPGQDFPDPQLHVHLERPNFVRTVDGKFLTLDAGWLYKSQKEFGAVVDVAFYQRLQARLPELASAMVVDWSGHGLRLNDASVSKELVAEFSKRSEQIQAEKKTMATAGQAAAQAIAVRSRNAKDIELGDSLDGHWREAIPTVELKASTAKDLQAPSLAELQRMVFRGSTVIDEFAIDSAAAHLTIGKGGLEEIEATKSEIYKQLGLIEIPQQPDENGRMPPKRYTTKELFTLEADCVKAVHAGLDDPSWNVGRAFVDQVIDDYEKEKQATQKPGEKPFRLTQEQRQAAYDLTGPGQYTFFKGAAGVGKSSTLAPTFRVYAEVFKAQGRRVIGVAPANKQATELAKSTGIQAQTVHSLLIKHQNALAAQQAGKRLKQQDLIGRGDIVVCDEAGMLDTYQMHNLVVACHQAGARLICVGDRNQHDAVETAALFGLLHDVVGDRCAKIETIARQVDQFRPTAQALYEGKVSDAVRHMQRDDQLKVFADGVNEADELVGDVFADMKAGLPGKDSVVRELDWSQILVLTDTNEQVRALNDKIRDARFARGELSAVGSVSIETEVLPGERFTIQVAIGDRLLLRKTAKDSQNEPIYNGDLGTVLGIERVTREVDGERIEDILFTITRDDGRTVKINASEYESLQHGYAMTGHKAQGMTVMQSYYLPSSYASLQAWYVAYTRGIHGCKTYLSEANWLPFKKSTAEFVYKENALDLMPQAREAIRASVHTGQPFRLTPQKLSVLDRLQGASPLFQFPGQAKEQPQEQPRQSVTVLPPVEVEIEHAKAFGAEIVDFRIDEQTWPADARRVAVVAAENPAPGAEVARWTNPGSSVPPEQRRDLCETLQGMKTALFTTKLKLIKPEPQEARYVRIDPVRPATLAGLGRYPRVDGRPVAAADGVSRPESRADAAGQRVAGSLGQFDRAAGAGDAANEEAFSRPLGNIKRPAGRAPSDCLRTLSTCDLAAGPGRGREGVLPDNTLADRQPLGRVRRQVPGTALARSMKYDKASDAREVAAMKRDVDLTDYAAHLGMEYDKKASYKGHAVFRHASGKYDIYQAADDNWVWHDRHSGKSGDIFKLYQEVSGGTFIQAKDDIRAFQGGVLPSLGKSAEEQARIDRAREESRQRKERERLETIATSTENHYRTFGFMSRRDSYLSQERGISSEVLAETRWRTSRHGSAVFPHIDANAKFCGYEYRGAQVINGERREYKGFTTETEKGVYLANPKCANPTEIRFSEGGVDTLSTYQLASPEERQRILFIGTTGEPGPNTEAAIIALAERYKIQRFSLAYDRDQGGDSLTVKRHARLVSQFAGVQIEDVRERIGLQLGEDPNEALKRIEAMSAQREVQNSETVALAEPTTRPVAQPETQPSYDEDEANYSHRSSI
ncbi:AAA family ATPase [Pseudomonas sp. TH49]|uniref:MobF family relaxase n=1 Tax=Pseudomonas sp. TH49 TaxID=2796413 RepID=UPI0019149A47|nr:MobF family relaxase [Pseudomonas sp. TH49]MBK5342657.1 AAA family ATPase [Pseudomonas sp. TH49]